MQPRLYWQIHTLAFMLEKQADEALDEQVGIRFAQFKVLEAIGRNTHARQNMVADLLDQTEASISRQIKLLEKRRLITVGIVMGNKRARELDLTEDGEKLLRQAHEVLDVVQAHIVGELSGREQNFVNEMLIKMIENARS